MIMPVANRRFGVSGTNTFNTWKAVDPPSDRLVWCHRWLWIWFSPCLRPAFLDSWASAPMATYSLHSLLPVEYGPVSFCLLWYLSIAKSCQVFVLALYESVKCSWSVGFFSWASFVSLMASSKCWRWREQLGNQHMRDVLMPFFITMEVRSVHCPTYSSPPWRRLSPLRVERQKHMKHRGVPFLFRKWRKNTRDLFSLQNLPRKITCHTKNNFSWSIDQICVGLASHFWCWDSNPWFVVESARLVAQSLLVIEKKHTQAHLETGQYKHSLCLEAAQ